MAQKNNYIPRDISWLSFNERVFQEATDKTVPLIERIKFLGIFSSNLDEFFRVRVATLRRLSEVKKNAREVMGENPKKLLKKIYKSVLEQQKKVDEVFAQLVKELASQKILILNERNLNEDQAAFVKDYFKTKVLPTLAPVMIDFTPKFPFLNDRAIYFAVKLFKKDKNSKGVKYSLIQIPTHILPRFVVFPKKARSENRHIILLDDIIRYCLKEVFAVLNVDSADAYTIKLTRDAELDIDQDFSKSIVEKIQASLKQRKVGDPVRLVYDSAIPPDLLNFITKKIKAKKSLTLIPGGRYHNFRDFMKFPNVGNSDLLYHQHPPLPHPDLQKSRSMFTVLRKKDILLSHPYHSFNYIIDLLREASIDPKVTSIKMTLYRVAENSNICSTLINALKNGKTVSVVVELQARFDEESNLYWANQLKEEGAEIIYGISGLKVHSKLLLITRNEDSNMTDYVCIGTGNFNEKTADSYCDHSLLTSDENITGEVAKIFHFYRNNFHIGAYKHLLVSPFTMREKLVTFIRKEIKNAKAGKDAFIMLKLNSLVDQEIVEKLYEASKAGVKIKLIIRGSCSVMTGIKGLSENIEAISIIDKYLEHARILVFCNEGEERIYITSADWMYRNFDLRNEVAVPIYDEKIRTDIMAMLNIQLSDNTKARILDDKQSNKYKQALPGAKKIRTQNEIFYYLKKF